MPILRNLYSIAFWIIFSDIFPFIFCSDHLIQDRICVRLIIASYSGLHTLYAMKRNYFKDYFFFAWVIPGYSKSHWSHNNMVTGVFQSNSRGMVFQSNPPEIDDCVYLNASVSCVEFLRTYTRPTKFFESMAVGIGKQYMCFINSEGVLYESGKITASESVSRPQKIDTGNVCFDMVSVGGGHRVALGCDGGVYTWGVSTYGCLGLSGDDVVPRPTLIQSDLFGNKRTVMVACGRHFTLVLTEEGRIWSFGCGVEGHLGHGDLKDRLYPTEIDSEYFAGEKYACTNLCVNIFCMFVCCIEASC